MKVAILLNGSALTAEITEEKIICADGGYKLLPEKFTPLCIIGDGDSLNDFPRHVKAVRFPPEKNMTDGELAVRYAVENGYNEISIYGAMGGRQDHIQGNLNLLSVADSLGANAIIREKNLNIYLARGDFNLNAEIGDIISVLPIGEALVLNSKNLSYPLENLKLTCRDTRGISNIACGAAVALKIEYGNALVFHYFR